MAHATDMTTEGAEEGQGEAGIIDAESVWEGEGTLKGKLHRPHPIRCYEVKQQFAVNGHRLRSEGVYDD